MMTWPVHRQAGLSGGGRGREATLNAGESAVNWVKNNPADAGLLGQSVAVGLAFPISAFASPEAAAGQGLAKAAVTARSVVVGVAVDKAMEKAQLAQSSADAALKAPSFVRDLIKPPDGPSEPGGISLDFDR